MYSNRWNGNGIKEWVNGRCQSAAWNLRETSQRLNWNGKIYCVFLFAAESDVSPWNEPEMTQHEIRNDLPSNEMKINSDCVAIRFRIRKRNHSGASWRGEWCLKVTEEILSNLIDATVSHSENKIFFASKWIIHVWTHPTDSITKCEPTKNPLEFLLFTCIR